MEGKVAIITGSTGGGIGTSTAFVLAKNGADIVLNYGTNRRDAKADEASRAVEKAVRDLGRRVISVKADTRSADEVSLMVKRAVNEFGKIDILVNNAGYGQWKQRDITEVSPLEFREGVEADIDGALNCIRECLPIMRKHRWGRIINIGMFDAGYWAESPIEWAIGKAGRVILTRHLALHERRHNITVNLLNPGPGHTAHFETIEKSLSFADHGEEWMNRKQVTPQDVAEAVLFLCTEQARFITGSHITFSIE